MPETCTDKRALCVRIEATPGRVLSPNSRVHWSYRMRAKNELGKATWLAMHQAFYGGDEPRSHQDFKPPITLDWTIYWGKGRKRQDADNLIASLKAAQDAVAAALWIDDKHFRVGTVEQKRDPEGLGYMELTVLAGETPTGEGA